jgi:hypothetical protein
MSLRRVGEMGVKSPEIEHKSIQKASGLPGPVQSISTTATGNTTASLSWSPPVISGVSAISGYVVETIPSGGVSSVTGTTATVSSLTANTSYVFNIIPQNSLGRGVGRNSQPQTTLNFNEATGGATTTFTFSGFTYRRHTFTSSGTLTVVNTTGSGWDLTIIGGGGNSGYADLPSYAGTGGGGGGGYRLENANLPLGNTAMTVGAATLSSTVAGIGTSGRGGNGIRTYNNTGQSDGDAGTWGGTSTGGNYQREVYGAYSDPSAGFRTLRGAPTVSGNWGQLGGQVTNVPAPPVSVGQPGIIVVEYKIS